MAGLASVWFLYRIVASLSGRRVIAALTALAFGLDPQLLYISHFARQEALILMVMLGAIAVLTRRAAGAGSTVVLAGVLVSVSSIFVHPNAFVAAAAVAVGSFSGPVAPLDRRPRGVFVVPIAIAATVAVAASFAMDGDFLRHYASFGDAVGVGDSGLRRLFRFRSFFSKLATQNAGTYYLPPVASRMWFTVALAVPAVAAATIAGRGRRLGIALRAVLTSGLGVAVALFIIGKYSPPSAVFFLPSVYLLAGC